MDRLRAMEMFVAVAKARSFSAAALRLGISRSSVTKHVRALERALGAPLLLRSTKTVSLTQAGEIAVAEAEELLERLDLLRARTAGTVAGPGGEIRIGTPPALGGFLLPAISRFLVENPMIRASLLLDDGSADLIGAGLDVSLRLVPSLPDTTHVAHALGEVRIIAVASPDYLARRGEPQTPAELSRHECLVHHAKHPTGQWHFRINGSFQPVHVRGALRSNFGDALRRAAIAGLGITLVAPYMVEDDLRVGRLRIVLPGYEVRPHKLYALVPHGRQPPARLRRFLDFLKAWARRNCC